MADAPVVRARERPASASLMQRAATLFVKRFHRRVCDSRDHDTPLRRLSNSPKPGQWRNTHRGRSSAATYLRLNNG